MSDSVVEMRQWEYDEINAEVERLRAKVNDWIFRASEMETQRDKAIELVLLFYTADWTDAKKERWLEITGNPEATTKTLCDYIRALKEKP